MSVCLVVVPGKRDDLLWLNRFVGKHYRRNLARSNIVKSYRRQPVVEQSGNYFGFYGNRRVLIQEQFRSQAVALPAPSLVVHRHILIIVTFSVSNAQCPTQGKPLRLNLSAVWRYGESVPSHRL